MGKFFFSAGVLTPSLFNDDSLFEILKEVPMDCKKFESRYIKEVRT